MPGDGATHGGTIDPRDRKVGWKPVRSDCHFRPPGDGDTIRVKSRDFH